MTPRHLFPALTLATHALSAGRGDSVLAKDLSLAVTPGTGLLLRGPNGAGKSTLLATLAGLIAPLSGKIEIVGHDEDMGPVLHFCGHRNAVRPRLTVAETLSFWSLINGPTGLSVPDAIERVGLARQAKLDAGYLSAGQQRRLALARLLVSARPIWLLDEPTAALDAEGHGLLASLLTEHLAANGLAIIATHDDIAVSGLSVLTLVGQT